MSYLRVGLAVLPWLVGSSWARTAPEAPVAGPPMRYVWCAADANSHDPRADAMARGLGGPAEQVGVSAITSPGALPVHARSLSASAAAVLDVPDLHAWPRQQHTIVAWVLNGGRLVLTARAHSGIRDCDPLATYLPQDRRGRLHADASAVSDMAWRFVGRGAVVQLAGALPTDASSWQRVALNAALGAPNAWPGSSPVGSTTLVFAMDEYVPTPVGYLALYLGAYLLALLPWRRRDTRAWLAGMLVSGTFTIGAVLFAQRTGRQTTDAIQVTHLRARGGERYAALDTTLAVGSPRHQQVALREPPGMALSTHPQTLAAEVLPDGSRRRPRWSLRPQALGIVTAQRTVDLGGTVDMDVGVTNDGRIEGRVTNRTPFTLHGACLVWRNTYRRLGALPPRSTVTVDALTPSEDAATLNDLLFLLRRDCPWPAGRRMHALPLAKQCLASDGPRRPILLAWPDWPAETLVGDHWPSRSWHLTLLTINANAAPAEPVSGSPPSHNLIGPNGARWQGQWLRLAAPVSSAVDLAVARTDVHLWHSAQQRWVALRELGPARPPSEQSKALYGKLAGVVRLAHPERYANQHHLAIGWPDPEHAAGTVFVWSPEQPR